MKLGAGSARIQIEAKGALKDHGLAEKPSPGAKAQKAAEPQEPEHQGTLAPPMPHGPQSTARKIRVPFVPPKPKELLNAAFRGTSRAVPGT